MTAVIVNSPNIRLVLKKEKNYKEEINEHMFGKKKKKKKNPEQIIIKSCIVL